MKTVLFSRIAAAAAGALRPAKRGLNTAFTAVYANIFKPKLVLASRINRKIPPLVALARWP